MSLPLPASFSDCLVFVDESGDHGMASVNRDFPLFALAFCVFPKAAYVDEVTPALRRLKVATFGHDLVVLHEHDIRTGRWRFWRGNCGADRTDGRKATGRNAFRRKTKGHRVVPVALRRTGSPIPKPRDEYHRNNGAASGDSDLPGLEAVAPASRQKAERLGI